MTHRLGRAIRDLVEYTATGRKLKAEVAHLRAQSEQLLTRSDQLHDLSVRMYHQSNDVGAEADVRERLIDHGYITLLQADALEAAGDELWEKSELAARDMDRNRRVFALKRPTT